MDFITKITFAAAVIAIAGSFGTINADAQPTNGSTALIAKCSSNYKANAHRNSAKHRDTTGARYEPRKADQAPSRKRRAGFSACHCPKTGCSHNAEFNACVTQEGYPAGNCQFIICKISWDHP